MRTAVRTRSMHGGVTTRRRGIRISGGGGGVIIRRCGIRASGGVRTAVRTLRVGSVVGGGSQRGGFVAGVRHAGSRTVGVESKGVGCALLCARGQCTVGMHRPVGYSGAARRRRGNRPPVRYSGAGRRRRDDHPSVRYSGFGRRAHLLREAGRWRWITAWRVRGLPARGVGVESKGVPYAATAVSRCSISAMRCSGCSIGLLMRRRSWPSSL